MATDWLTIEWFDPAVIIFAFIGWWILLRVWEANGVLDRWNATRVFGFILMIRTERGKKTLEAISRPRAFWRIYGEVSLWICQISMFLVLFLLLLAFFATLTTPSTTDPPSASELVAIPGLNPVIPLGWGAMAFIIGLVIHEFGHGIQARAHGMRVRSFGLLMLGPLPLGAFAEPQGEELMKAPNRERLRLFAAGPSTNLFACIICLLMLGGLAGQFIASQPGLHAQGIVEESGAADGGLNAFDTIVAIDNQSVASLADFDAVMSSHSAGDVVTIDIVRHDSGQSQQLVVNLSDKYQHYLDSGYDEETMKLYDIEPGDPFVGVVGLASNTYAVDNLAGPLSPNLDLDLKTKAIASPFHVIGLLITPFEFKGNAMHPIQEGMLAAGDGWFAQTVGLDGLLFLVNLAFWLLWVNFLLGMTNLIPIIPFDGGHMMRDTLRDILKVIDRFGRRFNKWKIHPLRLEHIVMKTSSKSSLFLFLMVAIIIIIPYF